MTRELNENEVTTKPVGMLYSQGRKYFLLHPYPLEPAEWQPEGTLRFLATPYDKTSPTDLHPPARHVVANTYTIDYYWDMPEIILVENAMISVPSEWDIDFINSLNEELIQGWKKHWS